MLNVNVVILRAPTRKLVTLVIFVMLLCNGQNASSSSTIVLIDISDIWERYQNHQKWFFIEDELFMWMKNVTQNEAWEKIPHHWTSIMIIAIFF